MSGHYVFDAYGTLLDVHSAAARHKDEIGAAWERLSQIWRTKQLEYTWVRAGSGAYRPFRELTAQSLDFAIAVTGGVAPAVRDKLLQSYRTLSAYPEVPRVLAALRARGARLAILSNGDPDMLAEALAACGLDDAFDDVLSVAPLATYKPLPQVYRLATDRYGVAPADISFQSSNRWDIAGAKAFGFRTVWINRGRVPDEYPDLPADRVLDDLAGLVG